MENNEPLSFVKPFEPQQVQLLEHEKKESAELFVMLFDSLGAKYKAHTRTVEDDTQLGKVATFETPLVIPFPDTSFVYALIYGHRVGGAITNRMISLEEYDANHKPVRGYTYGLTGGEFTRTSNTAEDIEMQRGYFSMIDWQNDALALDMQEHSEDADEREQAEAIKSRQAQDAMIASYEEELGYDGQVPDEKEVYQLSDLLWGAIPFVQR